MERGEQFYLEPWKSAPDHSILHYSDPSTYQELSSSPTQVIRNNVLSTLNYLYNTHRIDDVNRHQLTSPKPARTQLSYGLPKVHEPNTPHQPIVSACGSPNDQLSNNVTHFIQVLVEILPSYIWQQTHSTAPCIPPTSAWERYFTNCCCHITVHKHTTWGRQRVCITLHEITCQHLTPRSPKSTHNRALLETILKNNNLSFMGKHFLQHACKAMGTKATPPYANLFMGRHEETIGEGFIWAISFWKRFIDGIFLIFLGTTIQLQSMKDFMNNLHPMIKFTFGHSTQEIFFFPSFSFHHSLHLKSCPPLSWHHSLQKLESIKFQICLPSCDPILTVRKTILQVSTRLLSYHWEWFTTTKHLAQSIPHHCLPQTRIPTRHPSTFEPSQTNILTFCSKWIQSIITTETLMIIMRPYSSQPTPPNWHTPIDKGDLIPRTGASTNLKPTFT